MGVCHDEAVAQGADVVMKENYDSVDSSGQCRCDLSIRRGVEVSGADISRPQRGAGPSADICMPDHNNVLHRIPFRAVPAKARGSVDPRLGDLSPSPYDREVP